MYLVGNLVVVRTGNLSAYQGDSGQEAWHMDFRPPAYWKCASVCAEGIVFLASGDSVVAVDVAHKKQLWTQELPGCMMLMVAGRTLVCMTDSNLLAFDPTSGEKRWEATLPGPAPAASAPATLAPAGAAKAPGLNQPWMTNTVAIMRMATIDAVRVYTISSETLTSYDLKTGAKSEAMLDLGSDADDGAMMKGLPPAARQLFIHLAAADGKLYGVNHKGIYAFDGVSGAPLWSLPLNGMVTATPVIADGVLYYAINAMPAVEMRNGRPVPMPLANPQPLETPGLHALKLPP
jgi:outer membrane protein assembly factor BamB